MLIPPINETAFHCTFTQLQAAFHRCEKLILFRLGANRPFHSTLVRSQSIPPPKKLEPFHYLQIVWNELAA